MWKKSLKHEYKNSVVVACLPCVYRMHIPACLSWRRLFWMRTWMNSEETRQILHVDDFDTRILFYRMREVLTVPDRPATNQRSRVWRKGGTTHGRRTNHQRLTSNQPAIPCVGKGRNHTREEDEPPASDQHRVPVACLPRDGRRTVCSVRYLSWRQFFFYENVEEQQGRIRTRVFSYSKNKEEEKGQ